MWVYNKHPTRVISFPPFLHVRDQLRKGTEIWGWVVWLQPEGQEEWEGQFTRTRMGTVPKVTGKNWCFWTVVLEKTLERPWTARRSNQSILKEINPEYSLEGLMLKLKHQYFGHLVQRANSSEKTLMLGKTEGRRRRGSAEDKLIR